MTTERARALRAIIEQASASLDDKTASEGAELFPRLKEDNSLVPSGTRINWQGEVLRAAVDLWDTEANNPENAPTLWEHLDYKDGIRYIPETITVGLAFSKDELGWWKDELYKSLVDANVYNPEQYPANWEKQ